MVAGLGKGLARLAGAFSKGVKVGKAGGSVPILTGEAATTLGERVAGITDQRLRTEALRQSSRIGQEASEQIMDEAANRGLQAVKSAYMRNGAERLGNYATSQNVQNDVLGTVFGVAVGQNPLVALGSNVIGRKVGQIAGNAVRASRGEPSILANSVEGLVNFGTNYIGGGIATAGLDAVGGAIFGDPETEMRQQMTAMQSQRQMPSNGINRQFADVANAQGALQQPARPDGRQFADANGGGMVSGNVVIPPLDAATADKLLKRARENAQKEMFAVDSLTDLMGTF